MWRTLSHRHFFFLWWKSVGPLLPRLGRPVQLVGQSGQRLQLPFRTSVAHDRNGQVHAPGLRGDGEPPEGRSVPPTCHALLPGLGGVERLPAGLPHPLAERLSRPGFGNATAESVVTLNWLSKSILDRATLVFLVLLTFLLSIPPSSHSGGTRCVEKTRPQWWGRRWRPTWLGRYRWGSTQRLGRLGR